MQQKSYLSGAAEEKSHKMIVGKYLFGDGQTSGDQVTDVTAPTFAALRSVVEIPRCAIAT